MLFYIYVFIALFVLVIAALVKIIYRRKIHIWLPSYCAQKISKKKISHSSPVHILFCFVDHFEPGWNKADILTERKRVDGWLEKYPLFAKDFKDADEYHPRHTWFYPPHYFREEHILKLLSLCKQGFGEIEMHLHHNRMDPFPDTSETLRQKIQSCIEIYSRYGIFKTMIDGTPQIRYAFIHGDWALDNSRNGFCGVNNEITILKDTGCYADFTFPSYMVEAQPRTVNSVYYATDDPDAPKSYDIGDPVQVGGGTTGDLMMVQGPLGFRRGRINRCFIPLVDDGEIAKNNPPLNERIDFWINTGINVKGRPDWIIVKVFAHGAAEDEHAVLLGSQISNMHKYLQTKYNDGKRYRLHYVTARELYNIIKAAENSETGEPGIYRDYIIPKYFYQI